MKEVINMPYIVITAWFPLNKGTEAAEKYVEDRKNNPPDRSLGKEILQGVLKVKGEKVKSISVTQVKEGKLEEAIINTQKSMLVYHDIEGYAYEIEVFLSFAEALPLIGMESPE